MRLEANSPIFDIDLRLVDGIFFPYVDRRQAEGVATVAAEPVARNRWRVWAAAEGRLLEEEVELAGDESPRQFEHKLRNPAKRLLVQLLSEVTGFRPPWGTLTGVRPTKLVHQLLDEGRDPLPVLLTEYWCSPEKAQLVTEIAARQRPFLARNERAVSIYVGIPYCPTICSFCSFSAYTLRKHKNEVPDFLGALSRELAAVGQALRDLGLSIDALYLGGGTPTVFNDDDTQTLLGLIDEHLLRGQAPQEYTVEGGRPETYTKAKLEAMVAAGVTRVSVNPQTTVRETLIQLGRMHTPEKFFRAFELVRQYPFIINSDVIMGLPGEGLAEALHTLEDLRRLQPDNLTVHSLAVKRASRLHIETGKEILERDRDEVADMVELGGRYAAELGQHAYYMYRQKQMVGSQENVGYSLPGKESLYNIQMMEERQTIIGLGGSATTKLLHPTGWLFALPANPKDPGVYIDRAADLGRQKAEQLQLFYGG